MKKNAFCIHCFLRFACISVELQKMDQLQQALFIKYLDDQCTSAEVLELLSHFRLEEDEVALKALILSELEKDVLPASQEGDVDVRLIQIKSQLTKHIQHSQKSSSKGILKLWPTIGIAAAVCLLVFSGIWVLNDQNSTRRVEAIHYAGDAEPGKLGATLTLANGKQIHLGGVSNGKLAQEAGVSITKTAEGQLIYEIAGDTKAKQINILSTGRGETYQVKLPDGSKIWLNAASSLTYSASLNDEGMRKVKLSGEAYFEIEKDAAHPFLVESARQQVKVLGTHFNIKAYGNEKTTKTTLLEGSVSLNSFVMPQTSFVLSPGEQAINNGHIQIEPANLEEAVAWKNGNTLFKDKSLEDVMLDLSRWYDVEVHYETGAPKHILFSGAVSRARNLSAILERMQTTGSVRFAIQGKTVTVMK